MNVTVPAIAGTDSHKWLKRAGVFGFWFFLIKGTLWLAAPLFFYWMM